MHYLFKVRPDGDKQTIGKYDEKIDALIELGRQLKLMQAEGFEIETIWKEQPFYIFKQGAGLGICQGFADNIRLVEPHNKPDNFS